MELNDEVIKKIAGMDHLSGKERIALLEECEKFAYGVGVIENKLHREKIAFEKVVAVLETEKNAIRLSCKHHVTKYYPDASGNNDSTTERLVCGKTL